jgi:hypothetical protein
MATRFDLSDNRKNLYNSSTGVGAAAGIVPAGSERYSHALFPDGTLWNKAFPYQLVVLEVGKSNFRSTDISTRFLSAFNTDPPYHIYNGLIFTLPVNPESMSLTMPFAINVSATLGGVVEQHGGAPFRHIQFSGTFGVVNNKPSAAGLQGGLLSGPGGIAGGTMQAVQGVISSATSLGIGDKYKANQFDVKRLNFDEDNASESDTGYFQFRALQHFLESYAEAKKQSDGRDLRLALFIWKEEAAYLVTPQQFDVQRTAQSPYEYRYSLRLQAWRRIQPKYIANAPTGIDRGAQTAESSFSFAKVHKFVSDATRTAKAVQNTLKAVRKDIAKVFDLMKQTALFCGALTGIVKTAWDLPAGITKDFESAVNESWDILKASYDGLDPRTKKTVDAITVEVGASKSGGKKKSSALEQALVGDDDGFLDLIKPDSLNLSPTVRANIDDHMQQTMTLTSDDFRVIADTVFALTADFADAVGLNSPTYDLVTGRTAIPKLRNATIDDYRAMHSLAVAGTAILSLVVNAPSRVPVTTIEYVAGLANANGIAMRVPLSKFAAPFPYGSSMERLAQQYLGDASRWMEIVELNELRAPYVDEVGTTVLLTVNASGNLLTMTDASTIGVGQFIKLWSDTVISEKRRVVAVKYFGPNQWQVTLDGESDLAKFKVANRASVQYFLRGTVNSQQIIYIPSDTAADADLLKYVPGGTDVAQLLHQGDVDGMLSPTGDLVITPDGDWPVVFGMASLVQWARTALNTKMGSLALHPAFGVDAMVGDSIADTSANDILKSATNVFRFNPSFTGVTSAAVDVNGPTARVTLEVGVRGVDSLLPISFSVQS